MTTAATRTLPEWHDAVLARVRAGERLALLMASAHHDHTVLTAALAGPGALELLDAPLPPEATTFPSLGRALPGAQWYERELHDLFGLTARGRVRLDPLVLPHARGHPHPPRPGGGPAPARLVPDIAALPAHVHGEGVFTIPLGPVRSGVMESVEYLVEGPGEDIQHVRVRVYAKHRGLEKRFEELDAATGVLLAERVEGVTSVAHALAYCQAVERLAGVDVPPAATLVRVLYAELERVAGHVSTAVGLTEAASLAVANARFGYHRERVQRLLAALSGSRFGRGVLTPGGVHALPALPPADALAELERLAAEIGRDARLLMATPSFLDRLRGTGVVDHGMATAYGGLGPLARAAGVAEDVRTARPYAAYPRLLPRPEPVPPTGDVLARTRVRWAEVADSLRLAAEAVRALDAAATSSPLRTPLPGGLSGRAVGWAEAPQGEVLYVVEMDQGALRRCKPRSPSFVNYMLFGPAFAGDITTDFAFIEASFGLSVAGAAG